MRWKLYCHADGDDDDDDGDDDDCDGDDSDDHYDDNYSDDNDVWATIIQAIWKIAPM